MGSRTRAACYHLSVLSFLGVLWVPIALGFVEEQDPEFSLPHRKGAIFYQLIGILVFVALALLTRIPMLAYDAFTMGAILTFYWVFYLCLMGLYLAGAVYLSLQAWSGQAFDFTPLNSLVYGAASRE